MKSFRMHPTIYFGDNSIERLREIPYKKIMIVTDGFIVKNGMIELVTKPLQETGRQYIIFDDVVPDAPLDKIAHGVQEFLSFRPDCMITVGGGSAIDTGKAIREFAKRAEDYGYVGLIAIPTTSGTGSEVTSFAVVNDTKEKVKYPLVSDDLLADEAILDYEFVKTVPPTVTADTGMDVVTHAIEAYVSLNHNEFSAALAEKSLEITGQFLLRSYYDANDRHARQKMHIASCLAGIAFNAAGLGINHSIAHQLGARFHIPHGRANAMLLPLVINFNSQIDQSSRSQKEYLPAVERYTKCAHTLGLSSNSPIMGVRSLVNWTKFMMEEMKIPRHVSRIGNIEAVDYFNAIDDMADHALEDSCTATNPKEVTRDDIKEILTRLW